MCNLINKERLSDCVDAFKENLNMWINYKKMVGLISNKKIMQNEWDNSR